MFYLIKYLIRSNIVTITTMEYVLVFYSVIFRFTFYAPGSKHPVDFSGFQPPTYFQTQLNFKKIYYKCVPLCKCFCFEFNFLGI